MKNILINPKISVNKRRKEINDVIDHRLIRWLISNSYNPIIISNNIIHDSLSKRFKLLKNLNIKGIILSGGNDVKKNSLRYLAQFFLINYAKKKKLPILGICQGMQMLGVAFGSKLRRVRKHVNKKHKLFCFRDKKFPLNVNSYHNYSLDVCPKDFFVTTRSIDGAIESIKHRKYNWEGWMWHPERDIKFDRINNFRLKKIFN